MELSLLNIKTDLIISVSINSLSSLKNIINDRFNIPPINQIIKFNSIQIDLSKDFEYYQIKPNDLLTIEYGINEDYYDLAQESMISNSLIHIKSTINNFTIKVIIDTGAQTNIISSTMLKTLKLDHLLDTNFRGVAKGVGSANILGNIFNIELKIDDTVLKTNFKILDTKENNDYLVLLGLEFLLKYCDGMDFKKRTIIIGNQTHRFLNEQEIKDLEIPINEQEERIKRIKRNHYNCIQPEQLEKSLDLVNKIIKNIIENPRDDKYKSVNINSNSVKENILRHLGMIKLLEELGFEFNDKFIVYKKNLKYLEETSKLLY
jgi:hypothetical protein